MIQKSCLPFLFLILAGWNVVNASQCLEMKLNRLTKKDGSNKKKCKANEGRLYYALLNKVLEMNGLDEPTTEPILELFNQMETKCSTNTAGGDSTRRDFQLEFPSGWGPDFDANDWYECPGDNPEDDDDDGQVIVSGSDYWTRRTTEKKSFVDAMEQGSNVRRQLFDCGCYGSSCSWAYWCEINGYACYQCRRRLGEGQRRHLMAAFDKEKFENDLRTECHKMKKAGLKCMDCDNPVVKVEC